MTHDQLQSEYKARHSTILEPLAERLVANLRDNLSHMQRIDRITVRAKDPARFVAKALKATADGAPKYGHPFEQIQDMIGARIIVFYLQDVEAVSVEIDRYYRHIEVKDLIPESLREFGYVGKHFILAFPDDLIDENSEQCKTPKFFELQVKTLFQHAWSEAEHDISYKSSAPLTPLQQRQVAFTAAQAWGADLHFGQLYEALGGQEQKGV